MYCGGGCGDDNHNVEGHSGFGGGDGEVVDSNYGYGIVVAVMRVSGSGSGVGDDEVGDSNYGY